MGQHRPAGSTHRHEKPSRRSRPRQPAAAAPPSAPEGRFRRGRLLAAGGCALFALVAVPGGPAAAILTPDDGPTSAGVVLADSRQTKDAAGRTNDENASRARRSTHAGGSSSTTPADRVPATDDASAGSTTAGATTDSTTAGTTTATQPPPGARSSSTSSTASSTTAGGTTSTAADGTVAMLAPTLGGIVMSTTRLRTEITAGSAWTNVVNAATDRSGGVDLADQDNTHAARTLAAALVFARTGDTGERDRVVAALRQLPSASLSGARVLSVARQLGGYAIAADLVGYRDSGFATWIGGMRTTYIGNHGRWVTLSGTSEDSPNNWGAWAMASRIAVSAYLGDTADLQRAATVFRGFVGERSAYAGFRHTSDYDPTWGCGDAAWVPINPASCGDRSGAVLEDISRSAGSYPSVDRTGLTYSWEVLGGATLSARLLQRAGYTDVWQWGDRALLRAATFLHDHGGYTPAYRANQYIPHEINRAYGVSLGPLGSVGYGRQFGFTDFIG
jgi:hypothetical protein